MTLRRNVAADSTGPAGGTSAPATCVEHDHRHEPGHTLEWHEALRIIVVACTAAAAWFHLWEPLPGLSVIGIAGILIGGWPIFREAFKNLAAQRMTMELSMAIAIIAAAAISQFFTALVITLFVLIAEVLEGMTVSRGRRAIRDMVDFLPRTVTVRRGNAMIEVAADTVAIGEAVLVNPGGRIPVDGAVVAGHSFADESHITGESMPVEKAEGSRAYAGSINQSGALEIRAERVGRDTSYGRIIEAVEQAERSRAPVQKLADRLAGYLVYFALGAAALTFLVTWDIRSTISVVIVAGACGIAAGTPLAILGAIGRAAKAGAIVKGGLFLEQLGKADTVVLDKTGTLTFGKPQVQAIIPCAGVAPDALLDAAASVELRSEHPLGKTLVDYARAQGRSLAEPERFIYSPGRGIDAMIGGKRVLAGNQALIKEHGIALPDDLLAQYREASGIFVACGERLLGAIAMADTLRSEAQQAMNAIRRMGVRTILLTGDAQPVADAVARQLGITEVAAELLPEDKLDRVRRLVADGRTVVMLGDGVNDAPALAAASVGVAMGSGTDVARESADVVLLGNDLVKFAETLAIARHTRAIIWQNFIGTITVDAVGVGLAAFGFLNPLLAAFIHVASELVFILNSARLLPARHPAL